MLILLRNGHVIDTKKGKDENMNKTQMLMEIYQGLWLSADFECDLEMEFPSQFRALKRNENEISDDDLKSMYEFLKKHPVFN